MRSPSHRCGEEEEFPVQRLCKVLGVSQSGYFAEGRDRPACRRQHEDMVLLAHIRSAFAICRTQPTAARA